MSFTLPNSGAAAYSAQAEMDTLDIAALVSGISGFGVLSGCLVSQTTPASLGIVVASGSIQVSGVATAVSGGTAALLAADQTYPRFDVVICSTTGTASVVTGTPALHPVFPSINTATALLLAAIYVPALSTAVTAANIIDKRVLVSTELAATSGSASAGGVTSLDVSHGLSAAPTRVLLTPTSDPGAGIRWWVSSKNTSVFTISFSASATVTFDWHAQIGEG